MGSSLSTGGGASDMILLGPCVKYPAVAGIPAKKEMYKFFRKLDI